MRNIIIAVAVILAVSCTGNRGKYVQISGYAQGGTYTVKFNIKGIKVPVEEIRDSVDALLTQIDTTLSGYNKKSVLSRFNAGEKVPYTAMFGEMYKLSYEMWKRSDGALDCAAGPLFDAWGFGFKSSAFPSEDEVKAVMDSCGMKLLPAELTVQDVFLDPSAMGSPRLNFNAIAQGYSCDVIARYLYSVGVKDMLVDIGEIWCDGVNPSGEPWSVGVDRPEDRPDPSDGASELEGIWSSEGRSAGIVTSGNYRKFYIRDGRKYAHTIDPVSGYPVQHNLLSATVVSSESAAMADAVATWCMVIGLDTSKKLIEGDPSLEAYLIYEAEDGSMNEWASAGFTLKQ